MCDLCDKYKVYQNLGVGDIGFASGCDNHIMALVYSAFNGVLLDWAKERYPSFSHAKKRGGFVSLPFHLLEHISKRLLGFLASAWRGGREEQKRTHGCVHIQGHTLNVVKCSFNRFCTFGVTATGVLHYMDVIKSILHRDTDLQARGWLSDPMVLFALCLISTFSTEVELPFLKGSHHFGTTTGQEYQKFEAMLENWLLTPGDSGPTRLFMLYKRGTCRMINAWAET